MTVVEDNPLAFFSIVTIPRYNRGSYSFPRITPIYPWYIPFLFMYLYVTPNLFIVFQNNAIYTVKSTGESIIYIYIYIYNGLSRRFHCMKGLEVFLSSNGLLWWELIFIYCGLFILILVVFVLFLLSLRFGQISPLAFFRWFTATSNRNYCLP